MERKGSISKMSVMSEYSDVQEELDTIFLTDNKSTKDFRAIGTSFSFITKLLLYKCQLNPFSSGVHIILISKCNVFPFIMVYMDGLSPLDHTHFWFR